MTPFRRVRLTLTWIFLLSIAATLGYYIDVLAEPPKRFSWGLELIEATKSKEFTKTLKPVVVAVIDTGADITHPDLLESIWINTKEIPDNGVDDDRNGFIDDVHGWNFVSNSSDVRDKHGHGTHISGIIGGRKTGVSKNVKLMILKYYDPAVPQDTLKSTIRAIDYAVAMGAQIINFSAGGRERSKLEEQAIQKAQAKGILFVSAAGNEQSDTDQVQFFPADYDLSNILSVAALSENHDLLEASNFGKKTVDLAAPGELILSTFPGGSYAALSGTSQATAFATGAAALILSQTPRLKPEEVIRTLASTGVNNRSLNGKTQYQVQLNTYRALVMKDQNVSAEGVRLEEAHIVRDLSFTSKSIYKWTPRAKPYQTQQKKRTKIALKE